MILPQSVKNIRIRRSLSIGDLNMGNGGRRRTEPLRQLGVKPVPALARSCGSKVTRPRGPRTRRGSQQRRLWGTEHVRRLAQSAKSTVYWTIQRAYRVVRLLIRDGPRPIINPGPTLARNCGGIAKQARPRRSALVIGHKAVRILIRSCVSGSGESRGDLSAEAQGKPTASGTQ
jgi:hypothetical protein